MSFLFALLFEPNTVSAQLLLNETSSQVKGPAGGVAGRGLWKTQIISRKRLQLPVDLWLEF